ncbi:MAG: hypothetical protein WC624_04525 [Candidatus Margulisiibacteriota bacterium]
MALESRRKVTNLGKQLASTSDEAKCTSLRGEMQMARREFLGAAVKAGGTVAITAALGSLGVRLLRASSISLESIYQRQEHKPPFSLDYLSDLIRRGGVTQVEVEQILDKHREDGQLYALQAYALLRRVNKQGELSARYQDFLSTVGGLIKTGKIKFAIEPPGHFGYRYEPKDNTLFVDPKFIDGIVMNESIIIHELFHAYQDFQKQALRASQSEAEAYLVQSDFLLHVEPKLFAEPQWLYLFSYTLEKGKKNSLGKGSNTAIFSWPHNSVKMFIDLTQDDPRLENIMQTARNNYLMFRVFSSMAEKDRFEMLAGQLKPKAGFEEKINWLIDSIENKLHVLQSAPLKTYFSCKTIPGGANCRSSIAVADFSTLVSFTIKILWERKQYKRATQLINHYYIDVWQEEKHSLLDVDEIDVVRGLDGIE